MDEHERRVGINETLFREVNERVSELEEGFGAPSGPLSLVCECGDVECGERIALTREEYESVRAHGDRFVIVPGHDVSSVESVTRTTERFQVVEKTPGAAQLAREFDPRAHRA